MARFRDIWPLCLAPRGLGASKPRRLCVLRFRGVEISGHRDPTISGLRAFGVSRSHALLFGDAGILRFRYPAIHDLAISRFTDLSISRSRELDSFGGRRLPPRRVRARWIPPGIRKRRVSPRRVPPPRRRRRTPQKAGANTKRGETETPPEQKRNHRR